MDPTASSLAVAIGCTIVAGVMCGLFALPMKYLGRWSWENVWLIYTLVSCIIMPAVIVRVTVPNFLQLLEMTSLRTIGIACLAGFAWGFGSIMFGQCVSALGLAMSNTLVLAISASVGSFLPMWLFAREQLDQPKGEAVLLGTLVGIIGISITGYAGLLRERSQKSHRTIVRGQMVGKERPIAVGLLLCLGAGLLSAVLNIGYSSAHPLLANAVHIGYGSFAGSNVIWLLMLTSGAVPNVGFCCYLMHRNRTWSKFSLPGSSRLYYLSMVMGLIWGGDIFLYGFASPLLGRMGPSIGWPLKLISGLGTANLAGYLSGEWRLSRRKERCWMMLGLLVLLCAIVTLGWASTRK